MEEWPRLATSFSSLPTTSTPSISASSSSASLHPPLLLDLADHLWFSHSVVPFPSFSLPCLPPLFSSLLPRSPDPSTLLAELMFSTAHSPLPPSSISPSPSLSPSPPSPPPLPQPKSQQTPLPPFSPWDLPSSNTFPLPSYCEYADSYHHYPVRNYGDHACSYGEFQDPYLAQPACTGNDDNAYPMPGDYGNNEDPHPAPHYGKDEDVYPATGYANNEDSYHRYLAPANDGANAEHADVIEEQQYEVQDCEQDHAHADPPIVPSTLDAEDALSGIYDVGVLLKNQYRKGGEDVQHNKERQEVLDVVLPDAWPRRAEPCLDGEERKHVETNVGNTKTSMGNWELDTTGMAPHASRSDGSLIPYVPIHRQILPIMSALPSLQVLSCNEEVDMKENLKLWAHAVASTLHWKEGMRAKQVW